MDTNTVDRLIIGALCLVGLVGMMVLALSDHVEAAVSIPPAIAVMVGLIRNTTKTTETANQVAALGEHVENLSNGELTDRIRAGFSQAMKDNGYIIQDAEPAGPTSAEGAPYHRRQSDAPPPPSTS